jgi:hypothetical protein
MKKHDATKKIEKDQGEGRVAAGEVTVDLPFVGHELDLGVRLELLDLAHFSLVCAEHLREFVCPATPPTTKNVT